MPVSYTHLDVYKRQVPHAARKQVGILQHITDIAVQPKLGTLAVILAVNQDFPLGRLEETAGQIDQRAVSRACFAYDGDGCLLYTSRCV